MTPGMNHVAAGVSFRAGQSITVFVAGKALQTRATRVARSEPAATRTTRTTPAASVTRKVAATGKVATPPVHVSAAKPPTRVARN